MKRIGLYLILLSGLLLRANEARAFCGFYVAKADTKIFNKASQVVLAREDEKTIIRWSMISKEIPRNSPWSCRFPR